MVLDANAGAGPANSVIPTASGAEQTLATPSATQSGIKLVVKVIPSAINGISGVINPAQLDSHASVTAQQNGVIVSATVPSATGEFPLARLAPGNYDVVITADSHVVPVAATSNTVLSTTSAPINLATSTSGAISGVVTPAPLNPSMSPPGSRSRPARR